MSDDVTREDVCDRVRMTVRSAQPQNVVDEDTAVAQTMRVLDAYAARQVRAAEEAARVARADAEEALDQALRQEGLRRAAEEALDEADEQIGNLCARRGPCWSLAALDAGRADQGGEREYGVFRLDTGEQVGVGTTSNRSSAESDVHGWERDGFSVELRTRLAGPWIPAADAGEGSGRGGAG